MGDMFSLNVVASAPCSLAACPPGPFFFEGDVFWKSEYRTTETALQGGCEDAYCDSGEDFWGGVHTHAERAALSVTPLRFDLLSEHGTYSGAAEHLFCGAWGHLARRVLANAKAHGFESLQHEGISIALMHSELSEALEGYRDGNPLSDKIPDFSQVEEELADLVIRVMDHAAARGFHVAEALLAKMTYNATRPIKHGGRRF